MWKFILYLLAAIGAMVIGVCIFFTVLLLASIIPLLLKIGFIALAIIFFLIGIGIIALIW